MPRIADQTIRTMSPELISAMRAWVIDCAIDDDDEEEIRLASDSRIVRYVDRQYDGGIGQFVRDSIHTGIISASH